MFRSCMPGPTRDDGDELFDTNAEPPTPKISTLIEIVGATDLPFTGKHRLPPDSHCEVYIGMELVHKTDAISANNSPIFTVHSNSLGIIEVPDLRPQSTRSDDDEESSNDHSTALSCPSAPSEDLKSNVTIKVFNGKECLGKVQIPSEHILQSQGEREEYTLANVAGETMNGKVGDNIETEHPDQSPLSGHHPPQLALRFRPASEEDTVFLNNLENQRNSSVLVSTTQSLRSSMSNSKNANLLLELDHADEATDIHFRAVTKKGLFSSSKKKDARTGETLVRLQPPKRDPDLLNEPPVEWMTKAQVQKEALEPSWNWVETGHGQAGKLYLEIIGCDNLPNLDLSVTPENLTDPFVGVVYEDNFVRTKVLFDTLCPRWLPWSTRAFAFNISHPGSSLFLGIFDFDDGVAVTDYHDPAGRVVINTMNFESGTNYLLHYDLVDSSQMDTPRGTITVRLRIEWNNENEAAKSALIAPPPFLINVETQKAWHVLHYCLHGGVNMQKASMASVNLYLSEISHYLRSFCYFLDVVLQILLWRGQSHFSIFGHSYNVWFPIHSIWLFASVALAFEKPSLAPSVLFYGLAWTMISMNYFNSHHPYFWYRVKSFDSLMLGLVRSGTETTTPAIESTEKLSMAKNHADELQKHKADRMIALISAFLTTGLKAYKIYSGTTLSVETTEDPSWYFLSGKLYYPHMALKLLSKYCRAFRGFIYWKSYGSFPKTFNFCILGTLFLFSPVHLLAKYTGRILIWTLLGPAMKLVDIYFIHKFYKTNEELFDDIVQDRESQDYRFLPFFDSIIEHDSFHSMRKNGRIAAEETAKLKAMRENVHGAWSEQVPLGDNSPKFSFPLPQSSAKPFSSSDIAAPSKVSWKFMPGNRLEGKMLMRCPPQPKNHAAGSHDISTAKKDQ